MDVRSVLQALAYEKFRDEYERAYIEMQRGSE